VLNVLAAVAAARWLDVDSAAISASVAGFSGVARRTEVIGEAGGVTVVDDYAHHPSEIRTVLAGIRTRWKRPIRVVFQPHTYSRTRDFLTDFATAFGDADAVYVLDIYSARETDTLGVSSQSLVSEMSRHHASVTYLPDPQAVISTVARDARPGDLVVTMGAGDVYRLAPGVLEALA
jgi:UDP-N-acetylmuramate--alanine ligase